MFLRLANAILKRASKTLIVRMQMRNGMFEMSEITFLKAARASAAGSAGKLINRCIAARNTQVIKHRQ